MYHTTEEEDDFLSWFEPCPLEIDPEKELGLPDQHTGSVKSTEVSVPKEKKPYIVQVLLYLYYMRVPFDTRMGLKKAYCSIERAPMTKEINQAMKEFFETFNMRPHASGEFPVPENMEQYQYLEQTDISEDCCSFKPKDVSEFRNTIEAGLHKKAVEVYKKTHYIGSEEEAADLEKLSLARYEQRKWDIQKVKNEIEYLSRNLELDVPEGCEIVDKETYVALQLNSYDGYIAALENGLYDMFDNKTVKHWVEYKIDTNYYVYWDDDREDSYTQAVESLKDRFQIIDNYGDKISMNTMEIIKDETVRRAKKLLAHYMDKIKVDEKDKISFLQMVEDFFGTKGIVAETILPEPIVIHGRFGKYYV